MTILEFNIHKESLDNGIKAVQVNEERAKQILNNAHLYERSDINDAISFYQTAVSGLIELLNASTELLSNVVVLHSRITHVVNEDIVIRSGRIREN